MSLSLKVLLHPSSAELRVDERQFAELFKTTYFSKLEFSDWETEQWIRKRCARALKREKVGDLAKWLGALHKNVLENPQVPDVTIRWIDETIGYGLFTNQPLKKWAYIGEYTGLVRRRQLFFPNINEYCFMYPREWWALRSYTIDSQVHGNYTRFINHRDEPNCESISVLHDGVFHIMFRTMEEIPAGTELTYDYGDIYWRRRKKLHDLT